MLTQVKNVHWLMTCVNRGFSNKILTLSFKCDCSWNLPYIIIDYSKSMEDFKSGIRDYLHVLLLNTGKVTVLL